MSTSIFLAKLLGPVYGLRGLVMLVKTDASLAIFKQIVGNIVLMYLGGFIFLLGGLAIVLNHNIIAADWRIIVTYFGWMNVARGVTAILWPQGMQAIETRILRRQNFMAAGATEFVLGS